MSLSVYVHVPFCRSRCAYCAFYSGEPARLLPGFEALVAAEATLRSPSWSGPASTLYLGGGTPSLLGARRVSEIIEAVDRAWALEPGAEITLEANPASEPDLPALRSAGVTRLSVGVQSLSDEALSFLGRPHDAREALATVERAARAGFEAVSADLLFGVPGTSPALLREAVRRLREAGAAHVSTYALELHPGSRLAAAAASGAFVPCPPEEEEAQWLALEEALGAAGYEGYEVSNYSLPGARCRHNLAYWEGAPYVGLGPGAHGYDPGAGPWGCRRWNDPGLPAYARAVAAGAPPPGGSEELSADEALLEELFLSLRRPLSLDVSRLCARYGLAPEAAVLPFRRARDEGLLRELESEPGRYAPTRAGLRRADGLALWLLEGMGRPAARARSASATRGASP